jgi:hypothetical protein
MKDAEFISRCRSAQKLAERLGYSKTSAGLINVIEERCDLSRRKEEKVTHVAKSVALTVE